MTEERKNRKSRTGIVVSNKADKTLVVNVMRQVVHPQYRKIVRKKKRYMVHDEKNECAIGDTVRITETRPLSKLKRWRVSEILVKAK